MASPRRSWPPPTGILGGIAYLLIGWAGLLVPSLVRSIEASFGQSDAGFGIYYLVMALGYTGGSLGGGLVTERFGRRPVIALAAALLAVGLVTLGIAPSWEIVLVAGLPIGLGSGALDGGMNGLFLDVYRSGRGRAMNLLHLSYSVGALTAPLAVGPLVEAGVPWPTFLVATGAAAGLVALISLATSMPGGRHRHATDQDGIPADGSWTARGSIPPPLLLMCLAIGCYVASEVGVTDWLVRFLESVPLSVATSALSLYWGGMAVGRLASARVADRFDHLQYVTLAAALMSAALAGAILVPSVPLSIGLFAVAGFAAGPIAPMIVAVGGDRYPDRSAAVGGYLTTAAVAGGIGLPTVMGFLSVTVGLTIAMLGTVVFGLASLAALALVGRNRANARTRGSLRG